MHFHGWLTRDFTIREISRSSLRCNNCYTCSWRMIPWCCCCIYFVCCSSSTYKAQVSPGIRSQIVAKDRGCLFRTSFWRRPIIISGILQIHQRSTFPIWLMIATIWATWRSTFWFITTTTVKWWPLQWRRLTRHFKQGTLLFTWKRGTTVQFVSFLALTAAARTFWRLVDSLRRQPPSSR